MIKICNWLFTVKQNKLLFNSCLHVDKLVTKPIYTGMSDSYKMYTTILSNNAGINAFKFLRLHHCIEKQALQTGRTCSNFLTIKRKHYMKTPQSSISIPVPLKNSNIKTKGEFWKPKQHLIDDINETKQKVKEKVDDIIERENIYTIPNLLCVSRIVMSPFLSYAVVSSHYSLALGMFVYAGFTDMLDGMIARAYPSQASKIGSFLDPLADKVLVATLFLSLTYGNIIPLPLTAIIVYRDFVIIAGASYVRYKSIPSPVTIARYFDATHATVQLAPTLISKFNTALQLCLISVSLTAAVFQCTDHYLFPVLWGATGISTVVSGISYIFCKDTYKMMKKQTENKKH